jgi:hypothetical protein
MMACPACASDPQINVKDFGATSDGKADATYHLDGTLIIPKGVPPRGAREGPT